MAPRQIHDVRERRPLSPDGRQRLDDIKRAMRLQIALAELHEMRGVTQASVAEALPTSRPKVGRIEKDLDDEDVKLAV